MTLSLKSVCCSDMGRIFNELKIKAQLYKKGRNKKIVIVIIWFKNFFEKKINQFEKCRFYHFFETLNKKKYIVKKKKLSFAIQFRFL